MSSARRALLVASVVIGVAAGIAMWLHVAPMTAFLDFTPVPAAPEDGAEAWDLVIKARGDETIDEIRVESISPDLEVRGPSIVKGLARGSAATIRLHLDPQRVAKSCGVRITQSGPSSRTYDFSVGVPR